MDNNLIEIIKNKTDLQTNIIKNIITLLDDGCTIPFIARYRKDLTNNASDEKLRDFEEIYEYSKKLIQRKEEIINLLKEKNFLDDKILKNLANASTLQACEDIYSPFKDKKSSRTLNAIEYGLEPLANIIQCMKYSQNEIEEKAKNFLSKNVTTTKDAINYAKDIIAQRYADDFKSKEIIRNHVLNFGFLQTKEEKEFDKDGLYSNYANISEKIKYLKSHRILAILRAVNEKQLSIKIEIDEDYILENIKKYKIHNITSNSKDLVFEAYKDGLKRLLLPSIKREIITLVKQKAQREAIELFGKNLRDLLLSAPLVNQIILGVDPGYKTGCKLAVIDENGLFLNSAVIYPTKPKEDISNSSKIILELIQRYNITAIAIGNGTASRETAIFIEDLIKKHNLDTKYSIVSEIGASVYSASKIASLEYPNLDVTIKGAISIAQRLRDPMAALVKIEPKSLGIGQYQHDVNQKDLEKKLEITIIDLVNKVGVDLNSASYKLLSFVSGISQNLAKNIVEHRDKIKKFETKNELLKVKGMGTKSYEQCVGFLRIKDGLTILDNTAIHPEDYQLANFIQQSYSVECIKDFDDIAIKLKTSPTKVKDIVNELSKPGYDVRFEFNQVKFSNDILNIEDLKEGYILNGIVRNITDFGAFIDIGLKNDALLHISQLCEKRISHPKELLRINQNLENIKVLSVDLQKQRVSLTLK